MLPLLPLRRAYCLSPHILTSPSPYSTTAAKLMPRRNVVRPKKPSKQLQRRRRARLKRRRDLVSKDRHQMKSHSPKMFAERDLTLEEKATQQSILTQDPAYAAMADELYDDITNLPMELLLSGKGSHIMSGKPQKLSREDLWDLTPLAEARLKLSAVIPPRLKKGTRFQRWVLEQESALANRLDHGASLSMHHDANENCGAPGILEQELWDQAQPQAQPLTPPLPSTPSTPSSTPSSTPTAPDTVAPSFTIPPLRDFNHVLRVCAAHGDTALAFDIYDTMLEHHVEPNETTLVALAAACSTKGDVEGSTRIMAMWRETFGMGESLELSTAHITSLCNAGQVQEAEIYFHELLDHRRHPLTNKVENIDPPLVNAMISGFSRNKLYPQAWYLYHKMQTSLCTPDAITYATMINVCAMEGKSEKALGLVDEMERKGFTATKLALNTVVKACARVHPTHNSRLKGDVRTAKDVIVRTGEAFNKVVGYGYTPDRHTYGALLMANSRMGRPGGCFRVLTDMIVHGHIAPDAIIMNHILMSYANALTVGKNEGRRAKNLAAQFVRREEKYALFGRNLDQMVLDTNDRLSARNFVEHGDDEYIPSDFLLGNADGPIEDSKDHLFHDLKFSDTGLLRPNEIGVNVDDVLNVLESGAYKVGMGDLDEELDNEIEGNKDNSPFGIIGDGRNLNLNRFVTIDPVVSEDWEGRGGSEMSAMSEMSEMSEMGEMSGGLSSDGGNDRDSLPSMMVDHEEYDTDALYEVGEEEEEEEEEEDWGEALSMLVRSGYTDVAFQDGHPYPEKKSLVEGASAVLEWMENTAGIKPNIFTLNSYLSVHARCMFLVRTTNLYLSFEKEHGVLPDTRTVAIMLEMYTRAKRFDHALAIFRLTTGTEHKAGAHEKNAKFVSRVGWEKYLEEQQKMGFAYVNEPNAFHYGVLIRGASTCGRYEDAAYLVKEMQTLGFEPRDADTFMLRKKILSMDFDNLDEVEDYIVEILGDKFAKRLRG